MVGTLHLQTDASCAILMDRITLHLLSRFVHNDGLSVSDAGYLLFVLYHTAKKIAPPEKPFLGGDLKINFGALGPSP